MGVSVFNSNAEINSALKHSWLQVVPSWISTTNTVVPSPTPSPIKIIIAPALLCPQQMTGFSGQGRDSAHRWSLSGGAMGGAGAEERELGGGLEDAGPK